MMFAALNQYYDRLSAQPDPDTGLPLVPAYGFTSEKISYAIVISKNGDVVDCVPLFEQQGKKRIPRQMFVPASFKRTGVYSQKSFESGKENAFFMWDKTAYSLGVDIAPATADEPWSESTLYFQSFKRYHTTHLANIEDDGCKAFLNFLEKWQTRDFEGRIGNTEVIGSNIVFRLDGTTQFLHESDAVKKQWTDMQTRQPDLKTGDCLMTGQKSSIARIHPAIKGVYGGQSSGGSIVSFNADAFGSYGKEQGENAPLSELAAFKYTTALNHLLVRENRRYLSVGDASTVFWAIAGEESQAHQCEQAFGQIVNPSDDSEATQLSPVLERIAKGKPLDEISPALDAATRFYIVGLAPNAARISVRFWYDSTFGELANRLSEHFRDLALDPLPWKKPPSVFQLLIQLVPHRDGAKSKSVDIPNHLAGELMRSVLTGSRYPRAMLAQLLIRIRSDGHISGLRVAMIKAVINRDYRKNLITEELPVNLDEDSTNDAYQLGRLFAVLERIQERAIPSANATISDRYFATASTVPYSVFPRLLAGGKNHLAKLRKAEARFAKYREEDLQGIIAKLPSSYPKHFSIESQGRFTLGYYQQRAQHFTKTKDQQDQSLSDAE